MLTFVNHDTCSTYVVHRRGIPLLSLPNTGSAINTFTTVGGRIQNTIQNINSTTRNVIFDRRYANGMAPPWFPSTQVTPATTGTPSFNPPTISRVKWVDLSHQ